MLTDHTVHEDFHVFRDHRVYYERVGHGSAIVFLPNATLDGRLWEHQFEHFRRRYDTIVVDLPGFGRSERLPEGPSLELWVDWLGEFIRDLGLRRPVLVGNCMGSLSALHFAARNPGKVGGLVLMNMVTREVWDAGALGGNSELLLKLRPVRRLLEGLMRRSTLRYPYWRLQFGDLDPERARPYEEHAVRCWADPETRVAFSQLGFNTPRPALPPADMLGELPPVCWIWGEKNRILPLAPAMAQLDALQPDEVHILDGLGYAAAWEAPDAVNTVIERFLEREEMTIFRLQELAFP